MRNVEIAAESKGLAQRYQPTVLEQSPAEAQLEHQAVSACIPIRHIRVHQNKAWIVRSNHTALGIASAVTESNRDACRWLS